MSKISITQISNAHNRWLRSLEFYKQEINILKNMLTEIAKKNTGEPMLKNVEHYENQFKVQISNIDKLSHDIRTNISNVSKQAQSSTAGYIDSALLAQHTGLEEKFEAEETVINDIRGAFHLFASEWM